MVIFDHFHLSWIEKKEDDLRLFNDVIKIPRRFIEITPSKANHFDIASILGDDSNFPFIRLFKNYIEYMYV